MKNYFLFMNNFKLHCVNLQVRPNGIPLTQESIKANNIEFWYLQGSKFYTCLTFPGYLMLSQEFKDLYEQEGWSGLNFGDPIKIKGLKPNLIQPMDYYLVDVIGRCEKVVANKLFERDEKIYRTDWEVINDNGFDFFKSPKQLFRLCSEKAMKTIIKKKLTNIFFEDFKDEELRIGLIIPMDMTEF